MKYHKFNIFAILSDLNERWSAHLKFAIFRALGNPFMGEFGDFNFNFIFFSAGAKKLDYYPRSIKWHLENLIDSNSKISSAPI